MKNPIEIARRHPRSASALGVLLLLGVAQTGPVCHPTSVPDACLACPSGTP